MAHMIDTFDAAGSEPHSQAAQAGVVLDRLEINQLVDRELNQMQSQAGRAWVDKVFRNHAHRTWATSASPLTIDNDGSIHLPSPVRRVLSSMDVCRLSTARVLRISFPHAVQALETALKSQEKQYIRAQELAHRKWQNEEMERHMSSGICSMGKSEGSATQGGTISWQHAFDHVGADFMVGDGKTVRVDFRCYRPSTDEDGSGFWVRSWMEVSHISKGSGLFPEIDRYLAQATTEFIQRRQPEVLRIDGADTTRNRYNSQNYGSRTPPGYRFARILNDDLARADENGCIGIAYVCEDFYTNMPRDIVGRMETIEFDEPLSSLPRI